MRVSWVDPHVFKGMIEDIRKDVLREISVHSWTSKDLFIPQSFYVFLFEGSLDVVGMVEFFLYSDVYESYSDSVYSQAFDLQTIAPLEKMVHFRTLYVDLAYRNKLVWFKLLVSVLHRFNSVPASHVTISTSCDKTLIRRIHEFLGARYLGVFDLAGVPLTLSVLDVDRLRRSTMKIYEKIQEKWDFDF